MIDPHAISLEGYIFLGSVFYLVSLYIEWRILKRLFTTTLKAAIDEISEQYRLSLEQIKRENRFS